MPSHLKAIKTKVIEANPEIMELKFGSKIFLKKGIDKVATYIGETPDFPSGYFIIYDEGIYPIGGEGGHEFEILGRPIRLADVLLAIEKLGDTGISVDTIGDWYDDNGQLMNEEANWNLRNDSLDDQSPETIEFLYQLLVTTP